MPDLNPTPSEADTPTADRRPPRALLPLTLLLVILLRITAAVVAPQMLTTDADGYIAHAAATLRHHGFVGPFTGQPTAFRPPLYPLVLAAALACGLSPSTAVLLVSIGASVTCSTAVFWLARSMLGSHRAALLCALATAIDPLLLRYSIQPMTEVPCAALLTLACAAVAHAAAHGSQPRIQFAAGLLLAAAALTRPTVLLAGAGICLCQLALAMQSRRSPVSRPMP
ncbi:MAG: glycosyltransferase family 39 protein, partial [Planctomyces sp.]